MKLPTKWIVLSGSLALFSAQAAASECPSDWKSLHPAWIWCDDFEVDKLVSYFDKGSQFARKSGAGIDGSYGMRATWSAGQADAGSLYLAFGLTPTSGGFKQPVGVDTTTRFREIYYRVYLRSAANWITKPDSGSKFTRVTSFVSGDWSQAMIAHVWSGGTSNSYLSADPASCVSGGQVQCVGYNDFSRLTWLGLQTGTMPIFQAPALGSWNCIEVHVKLNDHPGEANGIEEFWIDGQLQASAKNLNFTGTYVGYGINALALENYINDGAPQSQSRDWDNFVLSTQRIGCSSPIAAPTNLRVIN